MLRVLHIRTLHENGDRIAMLMMNLANCTRKLEPCNCRMSRQLENPGLRIVQKISRPRTENPLATIDEIL